MVAIGGNVVKIIISATDKASVVIDGVSKKVGGLSGAMNKLRGPMLAIGAATAGMAAISVKSFADYETAMSSVTTLMDKGENSMDTFGETVRRLSTDLPVQGGHLAVAAGLYQTISAGISDTADATKFLELATKASIGGSAELETVILAGTKAMAAFGLEIDDTERIMDVFAATVKAGQTTLPELAGAFPRVAGAAGEMGMSLEETAGILAGLTKVLPSTDEAATSLNAVLTGMIKPSDAMKEALKELGFESGKAAIQQQGLMETLQQLKGFVDGDAEAMGELFGNVRALRAVFPALGTAAEDIADSLDIVNNSTGLMQEQFSVMEDTTASKMVSLQNKFADMSIKLGEALIPILEKIVPIIDKLITAFSGLGPGMQTAIIVGGILMGVFALLWPVISAVIGVVSGSGGLIAVLTLLTGPIGLIVLAIGLLAAAWTTNFGGIQDKVGALWSMFEPIFEKVGSLLKRIANIVVSILGPAFETVLGIVGTLFGTWWNISVKPALEGLIAILSFVVDALDAVLSAFEGDFRPLANLVENVVDNINGFFNNLISGMFDLGKNIVQGLIDGIASMAGMVVSAFWSIIPEPLKTLLQEGISGLQGFADSATRGIGDVARGAAGFFGFNDFISRPGMGIQPISSQDTILGFKNNDDLQGLINGGSGGTKTINIQNVNIASDYDVDRFKRRLAEDDETKWANRQNR